MSLGYIYVCATDGNFYKCDWLHDGRNGLSDWIITFDDVDHDWIQIRAELDLDVTDLIAELNLPVLQIKHEWIRNDGNRKWRVHEVLWKPEIAFPSDLFGNRQPVQNLSRMYGTYIGMTPMHQARMRAAR